MYSIKQTIPGFLDYLNNKNNHNFDVIFAMSQNRGWERWLQTEYANYLRDINHVTQTEVSLDTNYVDIFIHGNKLDPNEIFYVELKCQTAKESYSDIITKFKTDIDKVQAYRGQGPGNTICAIAFMYFSSCSTNPYDRFQPITDIKLYNDSLSEVYQRYGINQKVDLYAKIFDTSTTSGATANMKGIAALVYEDMI